MSNNLQLKVTADIADAQSKLAVLNAEFKTTQAQVTALARAGAAGTLDTAATQQLQTLTARSLELQAAAQPLATTIKEAGFSIRGMGVASLATAANAEELGINMSSATRFSRELFDEFSSGRVRYIPSTLAELAQQGLHLSPAMLAGAGGVAILAASLAYLAYRSIETQDALQRISEQAAFLGNINVSADFAGQLVTQIKSAADVSQSEAEKTATAITSIQNLSNASMQAIAGNIGVIATALGTTTDKAAGTVSQILDVTTSTQKLQELLPGLTASQLEDAQASQQSGDYAEILTERWKLLTSQLERMQEAQRAATQEKLAFAQSAAGQQDVAGKTELDNSYIYIHQLQEQQQQIERNLALTKEMAAQPLGPQAQQNQLKEALDDADRLDEKNSERRQILGEIAIMENAILHANTEQTRELEAGVAAAKQKLIAMDSGGGSGNDGAIEAAQQEAETRQQMAEQEIDDARETLNQISEADKQAAEQQQQIEQSHSEASQQIMRMELDTRKQTLDAEVAAGKISATQAIQIEKELTSQLYAEDIQRLQNELSTLDQRSVEYARVSDQIKVIKAQEIAELAALDHQYASDSSKSSQQDVKGWESAVDEIENAESGMVRDILTKRQGLSADLLQVGSNLITREISDDLKAVTTRLAFHESAQASEKALQQGGYLYHLLMQTQSTTATAASQTSQTAAVAAGVTAQNTARASGQAAGKAMQSSLAVSTVTSDAAQAAAGAMASVASIPIVGWAMAPAAGQAAFAATMAYAPAASLAVGTFEVPQDMAANIHRGEMVVPRTFAEGIRSAMSGAGGGNGETHYHHHGDVNVGNDDVLDALETSGGRDRLIKTVSQGLNRGLRP